MWFRLGWARFNHIDYILDAFHYFKKKGISEKYFPDSCWILILRDELYVQCYNFSSLLKPSEMSRKTHDFFLIEEVKFEF